MGVRTFAPPPLARQSAAPLARACESAVLAPVARFIEPDIRSVLLRQPLPPKYESWPYLVRLAAFLVILVGIYEKNRR